MSDAQDIVDALAANLAKPKRARTEAGEVEQHDLTEQVAAAKFAIAMSAAATSPFRALRFAQVVPPSAPNVSESAPTSEQYPF